MSKDGAKHLFGVQLELTQKLLAAEDRKLEAMNEELGSGDVSFLGLRKLANKRLRVQHMQLNKEYAETVTGLMKHNTFVRVRSLPSMGMRGVQKERVSLFTSLGVDRPEKNTTSETAQLDENVTAIGVTPSSTSVYSGGQIQSGSLEFLIECFTPTEDTMPEKQFIFTFLATSRLFIAPHELLSRIAATAKEKLEGVEEMGFEQSEDNLATRYATLLREWTEKFSYDFRDERMMVPLRDITKVCGSFNDEVKAIVLDIQRVLFKKLNALEQYEMKLKRELELQIKTKTETLSSGKLRPEKTLFAFTDSAKETAEQLKRIEFERLSAIGPEEFIQSFVRGSMKEDFSDMREAHNVEAYVEWFNRLTYIFATEIMHAVESKKKMAKIIEFFVMVGHYSMNMSNFNTVMALISALNFASIARMKKVWSKVSPKVMQKYQELEWLLDPTGNFKNYRKRHGAVVMQKEVCAIPIFSLMVKDIYFTEEVTKKRLENGDINFSVMWTFGERLAEFLVLKSGKLEIERNDDIIRYLKTMPVLSEYEMFKLSIDTEAPDKKSRERTLSRLQRLESSTDASIASARALAKASALATTTPTPTTPGGKIVSTKDVDSEEDE
eukprot:m.57862 g.57862  ORF g.57862 m.57862 type:complete len:610 (+) comp7839_c3_seq1:29-1858(+)